MTQQNLDFGTAAPNDGEKLGTAFAKIQANFDEIYNVSGTQHFLQARGAVAPTGTTYAVTGANLNQLIESGAAAGSLTSTLPALASVYPGFRVGFCRNTGIDHTIVPTGGNICLPASSGRSGYVSSHSLVVENDEIWLEIDASGNWRPCDGTASATTMHITPSLIEDGSTQKYGRTIPFLDENVNFGGTYFGWVNNAVRSPVIGLPNIQVSGTPTPTEIVGVRFQYTGHDITKNYTVQPGDTNQLISDGLAAVIAADAQLTADGFFTYSIPGGAKFNLQWTTTTPTIISISVINSAHTTLTLPGAPQLSTDFQVFQMGRTWGRAAISGDSLVAFDVTGPNSSSANLTTHWGQISWQIIDPGPTTPLSRMYLATGAKPGTFEPIARAVIQEGMFLMDDSYNSPSGDDMGMGSINFPVNSVATNAGIWFGGSHRISYNDGGAQLNITTSGAAIVSGSTGVGINTTPTGSTFSSALGAFFSGTQVPTTGSGIGITGGSSPALTAKNFGTAALLALLVTANNMQITNATGTGTRLTLGGVGLSGADILFAGGASGSTILSHRQLLRALSPCPPPQTPWLPATPPTRSSTNRSHRPRSPAERIPASRRLASGPRARARST